MADRPARARSLVRARALQLALAALIASICAGCAADPSRRHPQAPHEGAATCWEGPVTYYADALAGRPTASGEPYEPERMTAASRRLALGTWLTVHWQGRAVRVRVNDRGGPRGGVDLSRGAAEQLGFVRHGRVQARICSEG